MLRRLVPFVIVFLTFAPATATEGPRMLGWEDLVPKAMPFDNPVTRLSMDQQLDLQELFALEEARRREGLSDVGVEAETAVEIRHRLKKQGLDVDSLLMAFDQMQMDLAQRSRMTVRELDGQMVRIPGYALPLEHAGTGVTEMLLVPYVGACIHVPPPPANQTLYVKLAQTYKADNLYEPVWITGRMKVLSTNRSLKYVDGTAGVEFAFTLEAVTVAYYKDLVVAELARSRRADGLFFKL